jgi:hypothetical protein
MHWPAATSARLQAQAKFEIDALNVLKTNPNQINALIQRVGSVGLGGILRGLAGGGPGGPGRGGPGGPGGPGFMVAQAVRAGQVAPQALAVPADLVARRRNAHKTVSKSATKSVNPDFRQWRREHKPIGL